ncbi:hypothetical protein L226DRAFT_545397 [Lentinus tigrinus ALCF2SS1-7]|uniref:uncharacterized protein n=1 Tax=Lentinus tigrinus ALCF2SS1-7 TaxID=1328758 RepID=UPI001166285D|nr:hypothetical protein L226DRAFT_545397 [Lentinus tigrinus ALCF2SS1-7]
MLLPGQSPLHSTSDMLHPYSYTHSNGSKASISNISISIQSTTDPGTSRGRHLHGRPEAGPTPRAAARGISRIASRPPSRPTSRSRSRAHSQTPLRSVIDLPLPNSVTAPSTDSRRSVALPVGDVAQHTPETIPPISLPHGAREDIWPILVIPRYDSYATVSPRRTEWQLPAVTTEFPLENMPPDWVGYTHPEGRLYFHNPLKRIYTDTDVRDPKLLSILERFSAQIDEMVYERGLVLPPDHDLVLFLEWREISQNGYNWIYYFVDHSSRTLFWVDDYDPLTDLFMDEVDALNCPYDIKYELQGRYWGHIELYPHGREIPEDVWTELSGMLLFADLDVTTSMTTTVTYRAEEVHRMLAMAKSAKSVEKTVYATVVVARQRWLNCYGQTHARLGRDQSVYNSPKPRRTLLIRLFAPLFWNAPDVHLRGLEKIFIDGIIAVVPWGTFIGKLQNEWQEFVLYATVLLNANVAFLAIPSVDNGPNDITAAQISSYLSIITSVGSILLGLLLIRQHRVKAKETADDANAFLRSRKHKMLGLETLAIIYSLPYAMLMWGMVTFLVAFSFECFKNSDKVAVFTTAATWIAVAFLVGWTIYTGWEGGETSVWERQRQLVLRIYEHVPEHVRSGLARMHDKNKQALRTLSARAQLLQTKVQTYVRMRSLSLPHMNDPPTTDGSSRVPSV